MKVKYTPLILFSVALIVAVIWFAFSKREKQITSQFEQGLPVLVKLFQGSEDINFRGIDSVNDSVVWVSGSQGVFGKSLDHGAHWVFGCVPGGDSLELRDIEVFDENTAVIMSSGHPTRIFKTTDGGESWRTVFKSDDHRMFLDGMDFCDCGDGMAFGDPINGKFTILRSTDEGDSWLLDTVNAPIALYNEAGFAASGSSILCFNYKNWVIGTGGSNARVLYSASGYQWSDLDQSFPAGEPSQGIFSLASNDSFVIAVGGDYRQDTVLYASQSWPRADEIINGGLLPYQSSVEFANDSVLISIGTPGGFVSRDYGESWQQFTTDGMHTLVTTEGGEVVYAAGAKGRIGKIVFNKAHLTD